MMRRTFSVPALWPARRGSPRCWAHRPLPSMMMAAWVGRLAICRRLSAMGLDFHQLRFLDFAKAVYVDHVPIGDFLELFLCSASVVGGDVLFFLQLLQVLHRIAPDIPHGHPALLQLLVHDA